MEVADGLWCGRIYSAGRWSEALLVEGGRIAALGSRRGLLRLRPTGAPLHDAGDRLIVPALIDSHLHLRESVLRRVGVDLAALRSAGELSERLDRWVRSHPSGPVFGGGWDQERLGGGWPDRRLLDRLVPDRPVVLDRVCGHVAALNSAGLEGAGLSAESPDPPGGRIGRDPDGEPDGLLFESAIAATRGLRQDVFVAHGAELRAMLGEWSDAGLGTVGAMNVAPEELAFVGAMARERPLPLRIIVYLGLPRWRAGASLGPGLPEGLTLRGVKGFLDGAFGPRTAWLSEPYSDAPEERGTPTAPPDLVEELAAAVDAGLSPALHAIGDRAVEEAIRVIERLGRPGGARIEHLSMLPPALTDRLRATRAVAVVQPRFRWSDVWIGERLGPSRRVWAHPLRHLQELGMPVAGSSDAPVEPADPFSGMRAAMAEPAGGPGPQTVDGPTALELYLRGGARALGVAGLGEISIGAPADFLVVRASSLELALAADRPVTERIRPWDPATSGGEG